jgi:hypothetical protein
MKTDKTLDDSIIEIREKIRNHEERLSALEEVFHAKNEEKLLEEQKDAFERKLDEFSKEVNVDKERLKHIFDFGEEGLTVTTNIEGKNESERQIKATLCILTAYHFCYGRDKIRAGNLKEMLRWLGIGSLTNLNANLKRNKSLLIPKGKPGSSDFCYQITYGGLEEGKEVIRQLCAQNSVSLD